MHDLWLLDVDAADGLVLPGGATCWRALEGATRRAYIRHDPRDPRWERLTHVQSVAGASALARATHHYAVETDVLPGHEDEFDAWYRDEHLPGLAAVPGTVAAARYRRDGSPRHLALYDLTARDVLGSPAWLAVRATTWSGRVRPWFRNTRRTMFAAP